MVEGMIKAGLKVTSIEDYKETSYDTESKTRWGVCTVHTPAENFLCFYKVQLIDQKKQTFQVQLVR